MVDTQPTIVAEIVHRFFNRAKAVNGAQPPNILDIIDFGTLPPVSPTDPLFVYFFMEHIEGTSVTDLIAHDGPLPPARALTTALQIADALAASQGDHPPRHRPDRGPARAPGIPAAPKSRQLLMRRAANRGADARTTPGGVS